MSARGGVLVDKTKREKIAMQTLVFRSTGVSCDGGQLSSAIVCSQARINTWRGGARMYYLEEREQLVAEILGQNDFGGESKFVSADSSLKFS